MENSCIGQHWSLTHDNVVTGVPVNDWTVSLAPGQCLDIVPYEDDGYIIRPYGYRDKFAGDMQQKPMFPIVHNMADMEAVTVWMLTGEGRGYEIFERAEKLPEQSMNI